MTAARPAVGAPRAGLRSPWRSAAACGAMATAAAHLPVLPHHLRDAPYAGGLFFAFALMVGWKHRANVERLMDGSEPRVGSKA